jgi:hypothetical protein
MQVKTTWIYPNYNVGIVSQPAKLNTTISIYETSNSKAIILIVTSSMQFCPFYAIFGMNTCKVKRKKK